NPVRTETAPRSRAPAAVVRAGKLTAPTAAGPVPLRTSIPQRPRRSPNRRGEGTGVVAFRSPARVGGIVLQWRVPSGRKKRSYLQRLRTWHCQRTHDRVVEPLAAGQR